MQADCSRAATVHLGGSFEEIAESEKAVRTGHHPDRPFVLLAQPSLFDSSRAPVGKHTAWAYCHVPSGSEADMTDAIEAQVERFAPGFRERILARQLEIFLGSLRRAVKQTVNGQLIFRTDVHFAVSDGRCREFYGRTGRVPRRILSAGIQQVQVWSATRVVRVQNCWSLRSVCVGSDTPHNPIRCAIG